MPKHGQHLNLEEARKLGKLGQFAKQNSTEETRADRFDALLGEMVKTIEAGDQRSGGAASDRLTDVKGKIAKYLAIFLVFILAACQTTGAGVYRDSITGDVYPPVCRGDLSYAKAKADIRYLPHDRMPLIPGTNRHALGWTNRGEIISVVMIDSSLSPSSKADTLHHELCHVVAGSWHPDTPEP